MTLASLASTAFAEAPPSREPKGLIEVVVNGIVPGQGQVAYLLFNQADGFPRDRSRAIEGRYVPAPNSDTLRFSFEGVAYGKYAVTVYQDLNENQSLDKNFLGIPREPVGASMNPRAYFGPPGFDRCVFELAEGNKSITIHLVK